MFGIPLYSLQNKAEDSQLQAQRIEELLKNIADLNQVPNINK